MAECLASSCKSGTKIGNAITRHLNVNVELVPYKCFYFLYYSSTGSLFPYLTIFYKELSLSLRQTGFLLGIGLFVQFVGCLTLGIIADYCNKGKLIFLVSIIATMVSSVSLSMVSPANPGPCRYNITHFVHEGDYRVKVNDSINTRNKTYSIRDIILANFERSLERKFNLNRKRSSKLHKNNFNVDKRNENTKLDELNALGHSTWLFSNGWEAQTSSDPWVFYKLMVITIVGNFIAAPILPFADTATLLSLGKKYTLRMSWQIFFLYWLQAQIS